ncbi:MAG: redoxin domain-containing protein [Planctomycetes bacterium]|nr:redoxin domain-containing protein [Planctomycetota bacterium]
MINVRRRWIVLLVAWAVAAVTAATFAGPGVGREFPSFEAKDALTGKRFALTDLRGKVVLVDFWATWCRPCIAEVPNLRNVHKRFKDRGFEVVSISLDQNRSSFKRYAKKNRMTWRHVMEGGGWKTRLARKYGINSIPAMYLLDHEGKVISTQARGRELERLVAAAVEKLPSGGAAPGRGVDRKTRPKQRRSGDAASRLRADVTKARARLGEVAEPLDDLDTALGDARQEIRALETRLTASGAGESARRRYDRLRADLARIRCHLFVCGALAEVIGLPADVFRADGDARRADLLRAAGQLPVATDAVIALDKQLARVRSELTAMDETLRELARNLERDGGNRRSLAAQGVSTVKDSEALVTRCRTSWRRQMGKAAEMADALGAPGDDDASRFDEIAARIETCRVQLEDLAFGDAEPATVRDSLDAVCRDLATLAEQLTGAGVAEAKSIKLPTNPIKRARSGDIRSRVRAAGQLDVARDALARIRELAAGVGAGGEAEQIREQLVRLEAAARDVRDEKRLRELEEDFTRLAGRLLALHDRFTGSS